MTYMYMYIVTFALNRRWFCLKPAHILLSDILIVNLFLKISDVKYNWWLLFSHLIPLPPPSPSPSKRDTIWFSQTVLWIILLNFIEEYVLSFFIFCRDDTTRISFTIPLRERLWFPVPFCTNSVNNLLLEKTHLKNCTGNNNNNKLYLKSSAYGSGCPIFRARGSC